MGREGWRGRTEMETADRELLARYRGGDVDALAELVERYRRPLYGYILHMTEGRGDADDVFQEVWCRAIRKLRGYRHGNFQGWLMKIAHNLVIDRARKRGPEYSLDAEREDGISLRETVAGDTPDPSRQIEGRDLGQRIAEAVRRLPPPQREVFLLRTRAEMPFQRIAAIQGVSVNTALARMHYAVGRLRKRLRADLEDLPVRV
jgi:RNA polymerase sigma-70 factor (ECF subfamily)